MDNITRGRGRPPRSLGVQRVPRRGLLRSEGYPPWGIRPMQESHFVRPFVHGRSTRMTSKIRQRLAGEESGFTLIERLGARMNPSNLLTTETASYLNNHDRANNSAAKANVR